MATLRRAQQRGCDRYGVNEMVVCPDCHEQLSGLDVARCENCAWTPGRRAEVPEFLSSRERVAPLFQEYVANYDRIARDVGRYFFDLYVRHVFGGEPTYG